MVFSPPVHNRLMGPHRIDLSINPIIKIHLQSLIIKVSAPDEKQSFLDFFMAENSDEVSDPYQNIVKDKNGRCWMLLKVDQPLGAKSILNEHDPWNTKIRIHNDLPTELELVVLRADVESFENSMIKPDNDSSIDDNVDQSNQPLRNWKAALNRFMIEFEEQLAPHI